jgi:hypothetical protein
MPELFSDPEACERAAKLMRLLGSDVAGEAEAARTALMRLLARHGATADDLAQRLFEPMPDDAPALRIALAAAERQATMAEAASHTALAETRRLRAGAKRLRFVAIGTGVVAALMLVVLAWRLGSGSLTPVAPAHNPARPSDHTEAEAPAAPAITAPSLSPLPAGPPAKPIPAPDATQPATAPQTQLEGQALPSGRRGKVIAPEGVLLRLDPVPGTPSVALLPEGTKVVIDQAFPMLGTDWMQVRTAAGAGFVPASTIGPD